MTLQNTKKHFYYCLFIKNKYWMLMDFCMLQKLVMLKEDTTFPLCHDNASKLMYKTLSIVLQSYLLLTQASKLD